MLDEELRYEFLSGGDVFQRHAVSSTFAGSVALGDTREHSAIPIRIRHGHDPYDLTWGMRSSQVVSLCVCATFRVLGYCGFDALTHAEAS